MKFIRLAMMIGLMASVSALAHNIKEGPCSVYRATCVKSQAVTAAQGKQRWEAMQSCVTAAAQADTTNGPACIKVLERHAAQQTQQTHQAN